MLSRNIAVVIAAFIVLSTAGAVSFKRNRVPQQVRQITEHRDGVRTTVVSGLKDDFCPLCDKAVTEAFKVLPENATITDLDNFFSKICDILPAGAKAECQKIAMDLAKGLSAGGVSIGAKYTPRNVCSMLEFCINDCCQTPNQPEQVHLALTNDPSEMVISWATLEPVATVCQYSTEPNVFNLTANGTTHTYGKGGWNGWLHVVTLTGLTPGGTRYYYRCGDPTALNLWRHRSWTVPQLSFRTAPTAAAPMGLAPYTFALVADMGATDASDPSVDNIKKMYLDNQLDMVLHIGDISYADTVQKLQDDFQRKVEAVAAQVPYMTTPGNHEGFFNFTPYQNRYTMPYKQSGSNDFLYYSFEYGPVHFTAINTEGFSGLTVGDISPSTEQYKWIAADLAKVDRTKTPFLIVIGHRPFYCSSTRSECDGDANLLRVYLEDLFVQYKVDMVITGHVHSYERTYPVYKSAVAGSYAAPQAPVYVVAGAAGSKEQLMGGFKPTPSWSGYHNGTVFGFAKITITNTTSLQWDYIDNDTGLPMDSFTLNKFN